MRSMRLAKRTELFKLQLMGNGPFILCCCIISLLTLLAGKRDYVSHDTP